MDKEFTTRIARLFAEHGVTDYRYVNGGKHPLLIVGRLGEAGFIRYPIPSSGSDRRGVANCIAYLRRALDLHPREEKRTPAPRRTRCAVKRSHAPFTMKSAPVATPTKSTWQEMLAAHFSAARGGDAYGC